MYVNNSNISVGGTQLSISQGDLVAAQSLVDTYSVILKTRTTLNEVIESADLDYTYGQLHGMVSAYSVNGTELFYIEVTSPDPYEAEKIANTIAEILPVRISEIIDGASMEVVDSAVPDTEKVAPSITLYTALGLMLGVLGSTVVLVIAAMMDDTIHDEDYILRTYNYPILGKVPNLVNPGNKAYGYYSQSRTSGSRREEGHV